MCAYILHTRQELCLTKISPLLDISKKSLIKNLTQLLPKKFQAKPDQRKGETHLLEPAMSFHTRKKSIDDELNKTCHKKRAKQMLPEGEICSVRYYQCITHTNHANTVCI